MDALNQPEAQEPQIKNPSRYRVVLLNDDFTPMDFVVMLLQKIFTMNIEQATKVMMKIHTEGRGVCGVYNRDIAETRQVQVNEFSRQNKHVLKSIIEQVD